MLEQLRAWLNGGREFFSGVVIYSQLGDNDGLKKLFAKGKTDYCYQRLQNELMDICNQLKSKANGLHHDNNKSSIQNASVLFRQDRETNTSESVPAIDVSQTGKQLGEELYVACKIQADKSYKEVMNLRAELFAMARIDDYTDHNTEAKINQRSKLAIDIAERFKHVSQLYEKADYVKLHGRLPGDGNDDADNELNAAGLPNHLVKQTLDNLRKNYNKMKRREATPERVALLQKHEANIKKLEDRWLSLK